MDLTKKPGREVSRSISRGVAVDAENDAFIERRHSQRVREEGERLEEAAFMEVTRREEARRREDEDRSRLAICRHLEGVYARRSEEYRRRGDALEGREATDERRTT